MQGNERISLKLKRSSYLILSIMLASFLFVNGSFAQNVGKKTSLNCKGMRLSDALVLVERQSDYRMNFNYEDLSQYDVNVVIKNKTAPEAVDMLIKGLPFKKVVSGKFIIISRKRNVQIQSHGQNARSETVVKGRITDTDNNPLPGANVRIKGNTYGVSSNTDGYYEIVLPNGGQRNLVFSFIGMKTVTAGVECDGIYKTLNLMMEEASSKVGEVVVTGMFDRRAESFTGSATSFTHDQILSAGSQNLLKSLKNLDPSFQIVENLADGSDPNTLPTVQMRGQTSLPSTESSYSGNTNQPLFILDGFETTLQKVYDLDMNRVESITLLKDAAAKAIYGSKAANGVVVIKTVSPKSGRLVAYYDGNISLETPDLTGYNLMNAKEKFSFENANGFYYNSTGPDINDARYKVVNDNILKGVNTYWLSKPIQVGVGSKHTVTIEGGDGHMRYMGSIYYNNVSGAMKGSNRNTLELSTTLSYTYKNLIFRNDLEYTRNSSANSPYGSFSDYSKLNQYWTPYADDGSVNKVLGTIKYNTTVYDPLYNSTLNTKSTTNYSEVQDNFNIDWHISNSLRATGQVSFIHQDNNSDVFYPASHTMFASYDANGLSALKGLYTKGNGYTQSITANAGLNFNKMFGKNLIFANATWNLSDSHTASYSYSAQGFGNDYMDDITFASQYLESSTPSGSNTKTREIGIIGALNYSYDDRYLFDASVRKTGSSIYGSNNRWGTFWSLGAGWNLHNEKFLKDNSVIKRLKLRASAGYTGSQNFSPYQAQARYTYLNYIYDNRYGATLEGLYNNDLRWQKTMDYDMGIDMNLKRFLSLKADYYISRTSDLLSDITTAPSLGFSSYEANLGVVENKGLEVDLGLTPWRNDKRRGWATLTFTAAHNTNKIVKISDSFKKYNDEQNSNKTANTSGTTYSSSTISQYSDPSTLYYEGQSMTAIWGVRSLGIDPMTGSEMYLTKSGTSTYTWSTSDQVVIGDTNPKWHGTIGVNAGFEGFSLALTCSYKLGGDLYNTTLLDKVEDVDGWYNLDKRISDSWQKVGDKAKYKKVVSGLTSNVSYTKPTSRFVERNNELYLSAVDLAYDFAKMQWIHSIGLSHLKATFYMNDLLRLSTIKIERGTSYPYARNFTFSLQATF